MSMHPFAILFIMCLYPFAILFILSYLVFYHKDSSGKTHTLNVEKFFAPVPQCIKSPNSFLLNELYYETLFSYYYFCLISFKMALFIAKWKMALSQGANLSGSHFNL